MTVMIENRQAETEKSLAEMAEIEKLLTPEGRAGGKMIDKRPSKIAVQDRRQYAALHCARYKKCITDAALADRHLECHRCKKMEQVWNTYQKEVDTTLFSRSGGGEHTVKSDDKTPCPVNLADAGRKGIRGMNINSPALALRTHRHKVKASRKLAGVDKEKNMSEHTDVETLIETICREEGIDRKFLHSRTYNKKKIRPLKVRLARALKAQGVKNDEIAGKIGCGKGSVWNYLNDGAPGQPAGSRVKKEKENFLEDDKNKLVLDFSEHPDLLEKIRQLANEEFRIPESQVLYWLSNFFLIAIKEEAND